MMDDVCTMLLKGHVIAWVLINTIATIMAYSISTAGIKAYYYYFDKKMKVIRKKYQVL